MLGSPDQAVQQIDAAFATAATLDQPINVALICPYAAAVHQLRGEPTKAVEYASRGMRIAAEHGYDYWHLLSLTHLGIAKGTLGEIAEGSTLASAGLDGLRGAGAQANLSYFLRATAEVALRAGDLDRAALLVAEAFDMAERTNEHFFLSLLYHTRAEIKLALPEPDAAGAEADLLRALDIAKLQRTRSAELRAATSLHRVRLAQRRAAESRGTLSAAYAIFAEGIDTADLRAAKALLATSG